MFEVRMFDLVRRSLGNKIMAAVIVSIVFFMGVEIVLRIYFGTKDRIELIEATNRELAASTYSGIKYPMSVGDSAAVDKVLADVREKMEGVEVFICDFNQEIIWSTHKEKLHTNLAASITRSEPLYVLAESLRTGTAPRTSLEDELEGERYLITIQPIFNAPDCYHCHGSFRKILGGMIIRTNAEQTFKAVAAARNRTILITIMGITAIIALIYALVGKFVRDPVKNLILAARKVAAGNLDVEIHSGSRDEIGELARSFNQMTGELKNAHDEITKWAGSLEDLVEERTMQLKKAQEGVIEAEKMASMGRLAAIVAHEINNPLAGIRTYAKLLQKKSKEFMPSAHPQYMQYLETIEGEAARCGEIVRNLLQFARPMPPQFKKHDVNALIQNSLRLVQHKISLLNIHLRTALAPEPLEATCDGQKIKQALVAILLNDCDAVQPETGTIEILSRPVPEKKGVEISIGDNGVGMDEETQAHMFEPLFTTKTSSGHDINLGLGLSLVHEIITTHQGTISVESEVGLGTTITIFLPSDPVFDDQTESPHPVSRI